MTHLLAGKGEVGTGLGSIIEETHQTVVYQDPHKKFFADSKTIYDILHICLPYSAKFVDHVLSLQSLFSPKLTIIHSTVQVGTTRVIGGRTVYSFVRGRHPNLATEMTKHIKHIGGFRKKDTDLAFEILGNLGFSCKVQSSPEAVELGKLWDTTYYGICIAATKFAKEMADQYDIPWEDMRQMNRTYNMGSERKYHRPELDPIDGPIGGHCVVPNARILNETFDHPLLDGILCYGEKKDAIE